MPKDDLTRALDEIYWLRMLLAGEARSLEAHMGYATFPKSRRVFGQASVQRMRQAALGDAAVAISAEGVYDRCRREMRAIGGRETLTLSQWQAAALPGTDKENPA